MTRNKAKIQAWQAPRPLQRVDEDRQARVLSPANLRWRRGDVAILKDFLAGYSERDIDAYAWVGDTLYAVHRTVNFGTSYANLRVFLGRAPVLLDLTDLFPGQPGQARLEVSQEQQRQISERLEAVRQMVVSTWALAVKQTLAAGHLDQLRRMMAPLCLDWSFAPEVLIDPVVWAVRGQADHTLHSVLYDVMRGTTLRLPTWLGDPQSETRCEVYQHNSVGQRHWLTVHQGCKSSISNLLATLRLDAGPVAVVVNSTGRSARAFVEVLIERKAYGDLILLEGPQAEAYALAQKFSAQYLGVDVLDFAIAGCLAA